MSRFNYGSLFIDDVETENLRTERGSLGYIQSKGNWISRHWKKEFVDTISPVIDTYEKLMSKKGEGFANFSMGEARTEASSFTDFGLENIREGYVKEKMKEAGQLREEGLDQKIQLRDVTSLADAQKNRQARIQAFRSQKRALEAAADTMGGAGGATMKYNLTEYDRDVRTKQHFYDEFDAQLDERRQAYAQEFGMENYADVDQGWAMDAGGEVGQSDIDTFVMSDMLGMSYEDISRIFLMEGDGMDKEGAAKSIESLRDTFAQIMHTGMSSVNELADSEDQFRAEAAVEARQSIMNAQAKTRQETESSTQASIKDIKKQMRAADEEYTKTESYLNEGGMGGGGGAVVDIQAGRPE